LTFLKYSNDISSQVKCIINSTEFGDIRYKPNGYFEWGHHGNAQALQPCGTFTSQTL